MQLVSCIMPTSLSRHAFIPLAISYFLRQDYGAAELIILDDGPQAQYDLIPSAPGIVYVHVPQRFSTIGAKRNYACSLAKGSIILHWDDDDWYASDWISKQVQTLESTGAGICGLNRLYFFNPVTAQCWQYVYRYPGRPWVAGATMAYLKAVWQQHPFPDLQVGEDNEFVWNTASKVAAHDYTGGFVSILHGHNTSPKHTNDRQWQLQPSEVIKSLPGLEIEAYAFCSGGTR